VFGQDLGRPSYEAILENHRVKKDLKTSGRWTSTELAKLLPQDYLEKMVHLHQELDAEGKEEDPEKDTMANISETPQDPMISDFERLQEESDNRDDDTGPDVFGVTTPGYLVRKLFAGEEETASSIHSKTNVQLSQFLNTWSPQQKIGSKDAFGVASPTESNFLLSVILLAVSDCATSVALARECFLVPALAVLLLVQPPVAIISLTTTASALPDPLLSGQSNALL
jgi:hypothetical protein